MKTNLPTHLKYLIICYYIIHNNNKNNYNYKNNNKDYNQINCVCC